MRPGAFQNAAGIHLGIGRALDTCSMRWQYGAVAGVQKYLSKDTTIDLIETIHIIKTAKIMVDERS